MMASASVTPYYMRLVGDLVLLVELDVISLVRFQADALDCNHYLL